METTASSRSCVEAHTMATAIVELCIGCHNVMAITISGSLWTSLTMATTILGVMATSRQQAIETAERLFRAQGYAGTGLAQIITESGSPKGSFYFNFPGGKHELALEALKIFGERLYKRIDEAATMSAGDVEKF